MSGMTRRQLAQQGMAAALSTLLLAPLTGPVSPAFADGDRKQLKIPPIDRTTPEKERCKFVTSEMGQANAARDKLFDLRECKMSGQDASGFDISGALMANGDFSKGKFKETQLSKVFAEGANFDGADFTDAILDRGFYAKGSFRGTSFRNSVLTGSSFEDADLTGADFTDANVGQRDQKALCKNKRLTGKTPSGEDTRESAGCPPED